MEKNTADKLKTVKRFKIIRKIFLLVILIATVMFIVFKFIIGISKISGKSMFPTLEDGDVVIFSRLDHSIEYNDVVALQLPTGEKYVKRVVAFGGDTVDIKDGIFYCNGVALDNITTLEEDGGLIFPLTVPEGYIFVLGDNRPESIDSRFYGPVNTVQIQGVLKVRFHGLSVSKVN